MKFKKKFILPIISLIFLILVGTSIYFLKDQILIGFFKQKFNPKSTAKVYLENDNLRIAFNLVSPDQPGIDQFSDNLGVDSSWTKGMTLQLDASSAALLRDDLPANLNLTFGDKDLKFSSDKVSLIDSSLPKQNYSLATGSGNLNLAISNNSDFNLEINDPAPLLKYATASGKIYLSDKLMPLFKLSSKIATIKLSVNGENINGEIDLK